MSNGIKQGRARLYELLGREPAELTDAELHERLRHLYEPSVIPPCRVCGGPLSMAAVGGGEPTTWGCSQYEEGDGPLKRKEGRSVADEHYSRSIYIDRRQGGDDAVIELIRRHEQAVARGTK